MAKYKLPEPFGEMDETELVELLSKGKDATKKWDEAAQLKKEAEQLKTQLDQVADNYNTMAEFFDFVEKTPGLGDVLETTISGYVQTGGQPPGGASPSKQPTGPGPNVRGDPYVQALEGRLGQLEETLNAMQNTVFPLAAEFKMDVFKRSHPDAKVDEQTLVDFMNQRRIYDLEDAYKLMTYEDQVKAAEAKGQQRVMEGLKKQSEQPPPELLVPGAEGAGGAPGPGTTLNPSDYGAGVKAALEDPDILSSLD